MQRTLDLATWNRRDHFHFFRAYDNPYWNVTADVDVSTLHAHCRRRGSSFSIACYFLSLRAANAVEAFRYRIRADGEGGDARVIVFDVIHGGSIVMRPDESFVFTYFDYQPDYEVFRRAAAEAIDEARSAPRLDARDDRDDLIHYSVLPWVAFSSFSHARHWGTDDAVPKIVFGKHRDVGGRRTMPVCVEVHHALADGLHVGRFFEAFQSGLDDCERLLGVPEEKS